MEGFKRYIHSLGFCVALVLMFVIVQGCSFSQSEKPIITVTIQPQKYLLEKIVGDKFDVMCMLAQGSNPEAYEPSMNNLVNVEKSKAYMGIGNIGFELAILDKILKNNPDLWYVDTSKGVSKLYGTHEGINDKKNSEVDPHIWTSVTNAKVIAKNLYEAVVKLDEKNKKYYTKNYNQLESELDRLDMELAQKLQTVKGRSFAIWHPSLSYYARDYGLRQVAIEGEGKEPTASELKRIVDTAKADSVIVLFYQKEFDSRQAEVVSKQIGVDMVEINPMAYNWVEEMHKITDALTNK